MSLEAEIKKRRQQTATDALSMSVGELITLYRDEELDIHPDFQRFFRWTDLQKSRFIESLLLGIPIINTESNLNSDVLRNVLYCCGLEFDRYWTSKALLLDGSLLRTRNEVAHGSKTEVDEATYAQLHTFVLEILDSFRGNLENAALCDSFKR